MTTKAAYINPVHSGAKMIDVGGGDPWIQALNKANAGSVSPRIAWKRQAWIRACVDIRARAVSGLPWSIQRGEETEVWTRGQPAPAGMEWLHNLGALLYLYESALSLMGRVYVFKERVSDGGRITGLRWLNPETIRDIITAEGLVGFARPNRAGKEEVYPTEDVLHTFRLDPFTELGTPDATDGKAATEAGRVLLSMTDFLHKYFDAGMVRATLIYVDQDTSDENMQAVASWWRRWFSGSRSAGTQKVLRAGSVEPKTFGDGLKDLSDSALTMEQRQDIAAAFRVPMFLLDSNAANMATAQEYRAEWYQSQILPSARQFASALNTQVLGDYGLALHFHPRRMELFQRREIEKAQAILHLTGRPVMTVNEGRQILELPEMPGEDTLPSAGMAFSEPVDTSAKRHEAQQWRRKAEAKGRDVPFVPVHLEEHDVASIRARLAQGWPIESAFEGPFHNF